MADLAGRQLGIVDDADLRELGIGRGSIQRQLKAGRLHRLYPGVYAVGHTRLTVPGRWLAAVRACGETAVLSHRTAAAHWDLIPPGRGMHVTAVRCQRPKRGIVLHQVRSLDPRDRARRDNIPVTSLARTLLDVAETESERTLRRCWDQAERLRLLDTRRVAETCRRSPGRRGLKPLTALVAECRPTPETKRELEARFVDFCHEYGLPLPACNALVEGYEVDAYWPEQKLVVELDSWEFHRGRTAFERDRERDAVLHGAEIRPIRVTWRALTGRPDELAALLGRLLS